MCISEINELIFQDSNCSKDIQQKVDKYISILKLYYKLDDYQNFLQLLSVNDEKINNHSVDELINTCNNDKKNEILTLKLVINNNDNVIDNDNDNNNFSEEILLAPLCFCLGSNFETEYVINLTEMTIPMFHLHQVKDSFRDNFIYKITGKENGSLKDFITKVQLLDKKIYNLIQNYIKNINPTSPIYPLLVKNGVTETSHWNYYGIINGPEQNYLHINYSRPPIDQDIEGTPIYIGDELFYDMENVLSLNSYCFVHGYIYPIFRLKNIEVKEQVIHETPMVTFHSKAYFTEIYFKPGSVNFTTKARN